MRLYLTVLVAALASVALAAGLTWHESTLDHDRQASSRTFVHELKDLCTSPSTRGDLRAASARLLALPIPPNEHQPVVALARAWNAAAGLDPKSKAYLEHASDAAKASGNINVDVCAKVLAER